MKGVHYTQRSKCKKYYLKLTILLLTTTITNNVRIPATQFDKSLITMFHNPALEIVLFFVSFNRDSKNHTNWMIRQGFIHNLQVFNFWSIVKPTLNFSININIVTIFNNINKFIYVNIVVNMLHYVTY
jgi:hypothetical protein